MSLHALVEKWRGDAKRHREQFALLGGEQYNAPGGIIDMAITCEEHADELESALAGGGEAVAWVDPADPMFRRDWAATNPLLYSEPQAPDYVPLFTHPAGAVQVTEVRTAIADYMRSEGCSCCRDSEAHEVHAERLAKLLDVAPYADGDGYDFSPYRTALNPGGSRE